MTRNIVEILTKIAEGINNNYSVEKLERIILKNNKYKKNEVAAAYSWMYEKLTRDLLDELDEARISSKSVRFFSTEEKEIVGEKNIHLLMLYYYVGLINESDLNLIVEELKLLPPEFSVDETLKILIITLFLDLDDVDLPGSRVLLYSSDTIN